MGNLRFKGITGLDKRGPFFLGIGNGYQQKRNGNQAVFLGAVDYLRSLHQFLGSIASLFGAWWLRGLAPFGGSTWFQVGFVAICLIFLTGLSSFGWRFSLRIDAGQITLIYRYFIIPLRTHVYATDSKVDVHEAFEDREPSGIYFYSTSNEDSVFGPAGDGAVRLKNDIETAIQSLT
jgi:hypothetical protein